MTGPHRIAVVGAGIIGSTIAAALEAAGVETTVIATDETGSGSVTRASFAWVNARGKAPERYRSLNADARRMWHTTSPPWFHPTGAHADGDELDEDGWVDTAAGVAANIATVSHLRLEKVRDVTALRQEFDVVIVAAGSATARLVPGSPRLATTTGHEGYLVRIGVDSPPIDRILSIDGLQVRPDGGGRVAAQSLDIEVRLRSSGIEATVSSVWPALRDEISTKTGWVPPAAAEVTIDRALRAEPADGLPVIGWVDGLYVVVAHSGVTLAPLLAELVVRDLHGDTDPRLAAFRP